MAKQTKVGLTRNAVIQRTRPVMRNETHQSCRSRELDYRPIAPRRGVPILFREPSGDLGLQAAQAPEPVVTTPIPKGRPRRRTGARGHCASV
jgi:hypothetical protein